VCCWRQPLLLPQQVGDLGLLCGNQREESGDFCILAAARGAGWWRHALFRRGAFHLSAMAADKRAVPQLPSAAGVDVRVAGE